jgi:hypothetical protein
LAALNKTAALRLPAASQTNTTLFQIGLEEVKSESGTTFFTLNDPSRVRVGPHKLPLLVWVNLSPTCQLNLFD